MEETEPTDSYDELLLNRLRDLARVTACLNAASEDEHEETILQALPDVIILWQRCDRMAKAFASHSISETELLESLPKARQHIFERHYPKLARDEKTRE